MDSAELSRAEQLLEEIHSLRTQVLADQGEDEYEDEESSFYRSPPPSSVAQRIGSVTPGSRRTSPLGQGRVKSDDLLAELEALRHGVTSLESSKISTGADNSKLSRQVDLLKRERDALNEQNLILNRQLREANSKCAESTNSLHSTKDELARERAETEVLRVRLVDLERDSVSQRERSGEWQREESELNTQLRSLKYQLEQANERVSAARKDHQLEFNQAQASAKDLRNRLVAAQQAIEEAKDREKADRRSIRSLESKVKKVEGQRNDLEEQFDNMEKVYKGQVKVLEDQLDAILDTHQDTTQTLKSEEMALQRQNQRHEEQIQQLEGELVKARRTESDFREEIDSLLSERNELTQALSDEKAKITLLQSEVQSLTQRKDEWEKKWSEVESSRKDREKLIEEQREANAHLQESLNKFRDDLLAQQLRNEKMDAEVTSSRKQNDILEAKLQVMQDSLGQSNEETDKVHSELKECLAQVASMQSLNQNLSSELKVTRDEASLALRRASEEEARVGTVVKTLDDAEAALNRVIAERNELEEQMDRTKESFEAEIKAKDASISSLTSEVDRLQYKLDIMQSDVTAVEGEKLKVEEHERDTTEKLNLEVEKWKSEAQKARESIGRHEQTEANLQERVKTLKEERKQLEERVKRMEDARLEVVDQKWEIHTDCRRMEFELEAMTDKHQSMGTEMQDLRNLCVELKSQLEIERKQRENEVSDLQSQCQTHQKSVRKLEKANKKQNVELEKALADHQLSKQKAKSLKEACDNMRLEVTTLSDRHEELLKERGVLESTLASTQSELASVSSTSQAQQQEIENMTKLVHELESANREAETKISQLEEKLERSDQAANEMASLQQETRRSADDLTSQMLSLETKLQRATADKERLDAELVEATSSLRSSQAQIDEQSKHIRELESDLAAARQSIKDSEKLEMESRSNIALLKSEIASKEALLRETKDSLAREQSNLREMTDNLIDLQRQHEAAEMAKEGVMSKSHIEMEVTSRELVSLERQLAASNDSADRLRAQVEEKTEKIEEMRREEYSLKGRMKESEIDLGAAKKDLEIALGKLKTTNAEITEFELVVQKLQGELDDTRKDRDKAVHELKLLRSELDVQSNEMQSYIDEVRDEAQAAKEESDLVKQSLNQQSEKLALVSETLSSEKAKLEAANEDVEDLKEKLFVVTHAAKKDTDALSDEIDKLKAEKESLEDTNREAKLQIFNLEKEVEKMAIEMKSNVREKDEAQSRLESFSEKVAAEKAALQKHMGHLEKQLGEESLHKKDLSDAWSRQESEWKEKVASVEESLRMAVGDKEELSREIAELRLHVKDREGKLSSHELQTNAQVAKLEADIAKLTGTVEAMDEERSQQHMVYKQATDELAQVRSEKEKLREEVYELKSEVKTVSIKYEESVNMIDSNERLIRELRDTNTSSTAKYEDQITELRQIIRGFEHDQAKAVTKEKTYEREVDMHRHNNDQSSREAEKWSAMYHEANDKLIKAHIDKSDVLAKSSAEKDELAKEVYRLKGKLEAVSNEIRLVNHSKSETEKAEQLLVSEKESLKKRLDEQAFELKEEMSLLRDQLHTAEEGLQKTFAENRELKAINSKLSESEANLRAEVKASRGDVQALRAKFEGNSDAWRREKEELVARLAEAEVSSRSSNDKLESLTLEYEEARKRCESQIIHKSEQVDESRRQVSELRKQSELLEAHSIELEETCKSNKRQLADAAKENSGLKQRLTLIERKLKSAINAELQTAVRLGTASAFNIDDFLSVMSGSESDVMSGDGDVGGAVCLSLVGNLELAAKSAREEADRKKQEIESERKETTEMKTRLSSEVKRLEVQLSEVSMREKDSSRAKEAAEQELQSARVTLASEREAMLRDKQMFWEEIRERKEECSQWQSKLDGCRAELNEVISKHEVSQANWQKTEETMKGDVSELKSRNVQLASDLEATKQLLSSREAENDQLKSKCDELQTMYAALADDKEKLTGELTSTEMSRERAEMRTQHVEEAVRRLEKELEDMRERKETVSVEYFEKDKACNKAKQECNDLVLENEKLLSEMQHCEALHKQRCDGLEDRISLLQTAADKSEKEAAATAEKLRTELSSLEAKFRNESSERHRAEELAASLKSEVERLEGRIHELQMEADGQRHEAVMSVRQLDYTVDQSREEANELEKRLSQTMSLHTLEAQKASQLQSEVDKLNKEITEEREREKEEKKKLLKELRKKHKGGMHLKEQKQKLEAEIETIQKEADLQLSKEMGRVDALRTELDREVGERKKLEDQVASAQEKLDMANKELTEVAIEKNRLEVGFESLSREHSEMRTLKLDLESRVRVLEPKERELEQKTEECRSLRARVDEMSLLSEKQRVAQTIQMTTEERETALLSQEIQLHRAEADRLRTDLEEEREQRKGREESMQHKIDGLVVKEKDASARAEVIQKENELMKSQLLDLRHDNSQLTTKVETLTVRLREESSALIDAKDALVVEVGSGGRRQDEVDSLFEKLKTLRHEKDACDKDLSSALSQLRSNERELDETREELRRVSQALDEAAVVAQRVETLDPECVALREENGELKRRTAKLEKCEIELKKANKERKDLRERCKKIRVLVKDADAKRRLLSNQMMHFHSKGGVGGGEGGGLSAGPTSTPFSNSGSLRTSMLGGSYSNLGGSGAVVSLSHTTALRVDNNIKAIGVAMSQCYRLADMRVKKAEAEAENAVDLGELEASLLEERRVEEEVERELSTTKYELNARMSQLAERDARVVELEEEVTVLRRVCEEEKTAVSVLRSEITTMEDKFERQSMESARELSDSKRELSKVKAELQLFASEKSELQLLAKRLKDALEEDLEREKRHSDEMKGEVRTARKREADAEANVSHLQRELEKERATQQALEGRLQVVNGERESLVDRLRTTKEEFSREVMGGRDEMRRLEDQLSQYKRECDRLSAKQRKAREGCDLIQHRHQYLKRSHSSLHSEVRTSLNGFSDFLGEWSGKLRAMTVVSQDEGTAAILSRDAALVELEAMTKECAAVRGDNHRLESRLQLHERELETLGKIDRQRREAEQLAVTMQKEITKLEAEVKAREVRMVEQEKTIDTYRTRFDEAEAEASKSRHALNMVEVERSGQEERYRMELGRLEQLCEELRRKADDANDAKTVADDKLVACEREVREEVRQLEGEFSTATLKYKLQRDELEATIESLKTKNQRLEEDQTAVESRISSLMDEKVRLQEEVEEMRVKHSDVEREVGALTSALRRTEGERDDVLMEQEMSVAEIRRELMAMESEIVHLTGEKMNAAKTIADLHQRLAQVSSEALDATTTVKKKEEEFDKELTSLDVTISDTVGLLKRKCDGMEKEIAELKVKVEEKESRAKELSEALEEREKMVKELTADASSSKTRMEGMSEETKKLLASVSSLEDQVGERSVHISNLEAECEASESRCRALEDENQRLSGRCEVLSEEIKGVMGENSRLRVEAEEERDRECKERAKFMTSLDQLKADYEANLAESRGATTSNKIKQDSERMMLIETLQHLQQEWAEKDQDMAVKFNMADKKNTQLINEVAELRTERFELQTKLEEERSRVRERDGTASRAKTNAHEAERKLLDAQSEILVLQTESGNLQKQLAELKSQVSEEMKRCGPLLEGERRGREEDQVEFSKRMQEARAELHEMGNELQTCRNSLEREVSQREEVSMALENTLSELEAEVVKREEMESVLGNALSEMERDMKESVVAFENQLQEWREEGAQRKATLEALETELISVRQTLALKEATHKQEMSEQREKFEASENLLQEAQSTIESLTQRVGELEGEVTNVLSELESERKQREDAEAKMRDELSTMNADNAHLSALAVELQSQLDESIVSLRASAVEMKEQQQKQELEMALESVEREKQIVNDVVKEMGVYIDQSMEAESLRSKLKEMADALQSSNTENARVAEQAVSLREQLKDVKEEKDEARKLLDEAQKQLAQVTVETSVHNDVASQLANMTASLDSAAHEAKSVKAVMGSRVDELAAEVERQREDMDELIKQNAQLEEDRKRMSNAVLEAHDEKLREKEELAGELNRLQSILSEGQKYRDNLEAEMKSMENKLKDALSEKRASESEYKEKIRELEEEKYQIREHLEEANAKRRYLTEKVEKIERRFSELREDSEAKVDDLVKQLMEAREVAQHATLATMANKEEWEIALKEKAERDLLSSEVQRLKRALETEEGMKAQFEDEAKTATEKLLLAQASKQELQKRVNNLEQRVDDLQTEKDEEVNSSLRSRAEENKIQLERHREELLEKEKKIEDLLVVTVEAETRLEEVTEEKKGLKEHMESQLAMMADQLQSEREERRAQYILRSEYDSLVRKMEKAQDERALLLGDVAESQKVAEELQKEVRTLQVDLDRSEQELKAREKTIHQLVDERLEERSDELRKSEKSLHEERRRADRLQTELDAEVRDRESAVSKLSDTELRIKQLERQLSVAEERAKEGLENSSLRDRETLLRVETELESSRMEVRMWKGRAEQARDDSAVEVDNLRSELQRLRNANSHTAAVEKETISNKKRALASGIVDKNDLLSQLGTYAEKLEALETSLRRAKDRSNAAAVEQLSGELHTLTESYRQARDQDLKELSAIEQQLLQLE